MAGLAAPVLIGLLLFASGATAAGDDGAMEIPHLQLPGTTDSGRGHGSDALPPPPQGQLMDIMSTGGCGSFASILAATPNASGIFQERLVAGAGGLTVFCPDDKAVVAFQPTFGALAEGDRLDVLLHHAKAGRYVRAQLAAFDWVAVRTLAANRSQSITVRDDGDTVWLWTSWQGGQGDQDGFGGGGPPSPSPCNSSTPCCCRAICDRSWMEGTLPGCTAPSRSGWGWAGPYRPSWASSSAVCSCSEQCQGGYSDTVKSKEEEEVEKKPAGSLLC